MCSREPARTRESCQWMRDVVGFFFPFSPLFSIKDTCAPTHYITPHSLLWLCAVFSHTCTHAAMTFLRLGTHVPSVTQRPDRVINNCCQKKKKFCLMNAGVTACWRRYVTINTVSSLRRDSCGNCSVCESVVRKQPDSYCINKDDGEELRRFTLRDMIWSHQIHLFSWFVVFFIFAQIPWNCDAATTAFKNLLLRSDSKQNRRNIYF